MTLPYRTFAPSRPAILASIVTLVLAGCGGGSDDEERAPRLSAPTVIGAPVDPPRPPPEDDPVRPVDPPIAPPVEPPLEPPTEPPLQPPIDPPVEPPVEPPAEPPAGPPADGTEPFTVGLVLVVEAPLGQGVGGGIVGTFFEIAGLDASFDREAAIREAVEDFDFAFDTCEATVVDADAVTEEIDRDIEFISAGETLILSSPSVGTWRTVEREIFGGIPLYRTEAPLLAGTVPRGLVLDLPGEEFPTFSNVPFAELTPLAGLAMDRATPTIGATVRWTAADDAAAHVRMTMSRTRGETTTTIICRVRDDGEFLVSSAVVGEFAGADDAGFDTIEVAREAYSVVRGADAVLILGRSSPGT